MNIQPLSDKELDWLGEQLMAHGNDDSILDVAELDGFLTAVVSGPEVVLPSQWIPAMWGDAEPQWESAKNAQRFHELLIRHMNGITGWLLTDPDGFQPLFYACELEGEEIIVVEEWCLGYMRGVELAGWSQLPEPFDAALAAIALHGTEEGIEQLDKLTLEEHQQFTEAVASAAIALHGFWFEQRKPEPGPRIAQAQSARPAQAKVGRNQPCPCGSGIKYKHCCLH